MDDPIIERFACAPGLRLEAHERLTTVHFEHLERRLQRIEEMMERLERRLWLTVYGVVAAVLGTGIQSFLAVVPHH